MAEGRRVRSSLSQRQAGSDAVFDYECDWCKFKDTMSEAVGYCNACREFLCQECSRVHKKSKATKAHAIIQGDALRKVKGRSPSVDFEDCLKHPGKAIAFYCTEHDSVFCADCRVITHGSCHQLRSVTEASAGIKFRKETELFAEHIKSTNKRLSQLTNNGKRYLVQLNEHKQTCLQDISNFRDEINKTLDRLEDKMRQNVDFSVTKETNKIQNDISHLDTLRKALQRDSNNYDAAKSMDVDEKIFIAMKKADLQELMTSLDVIDRQQYVVKIDFKVNDVLRETLSNLHSLGNLETTFTELKPNILPSSMLARALVKVTERDVHRQGDKEVCSISGATFLPSGECLLCDCNDTVKLLNTSMRLKASVQLTSRPLDIALISAKEAVVSLSDEKKLQFIAVPDLKPGHKVEIGRPCAGLAAHKDQIYVTCHDDPGDGEVLVLAKDGAIQRRMGRTHDGGFRFSRPNYIAVGVLGEKIYVSDYDQRSVTFLTRHGSPVFHCVLEESRYPRCLLVDDKGGMLVCSEDPRTTSLQYRTPAGKLYRTLTSWPRGRWVAHTFCFRSSDRTLLVGLRRNNRVLVYRFE